MKVLIWNCPFPSQGDLFFFENSFRRHLLLQANLLSGIGVEVSVAYPSHFSQAATGLASGIHHVPLPESLTHLPWPDNVLSALYQEDEVLNRRIVDQISQLLPNSIDVVLTWENPVGYLRELYPDALVISQMPGAFCRAPYPNTVTFDPQGLYRNSLLGLFGDQVISDVPGPVELALARQFKETAWTALSRLSPLNRDDLGRPASRKALVPLQITDHYAFTADTKLSSQLELLTAARKQTAADEDLVVTQYRSKFASDIVLTEKNIDRYRSLWPNVVWNQTLESLQSPSQLLLPLVDEVITGSSSIGLQAVSLGIPVSVIGNSHVAPFDRDRIKSLRVKPTETSERLAGFLLGRYQPLYTSITADGPFLISLLEELLERHRGGRQGVESTASFAAIDAQYQEKLIHAFNTRVVANEVAKVYPSLASRWKLADAYVKLASQPQVKYLTFDVFDTLICRPTENPSDVYHFLQSKLDSELGLRFPDFAKVRMDAETDAREFSPDPEISLTAIYDIVADRLSMSHAEREQVCAMEVALETSFVKPRSQGLELWRIAKRLGKPIVLISDMYLPHGVVRQMVENCGFADYQKLYVSSEHGARKKDGSLFDLVLGDLQVEGSAVLHVGDHIVADIRNAQARGMLALRTPRAIDNLRKNAAYAEVYRPSVGTGQVARSAIAGLTAKKLFDLSTDPGDTLFFGEAKNAGFSAVGPLYVGFALWLRDQAIQQGAQRLYFLSREGHLMKRVYDGITRDHPDAPKSTYLYASRRAIRVAALRSERDVAEVASQPYTEGVKVADLLRDRFGLDAAVASKILRERAIDPDTVLKKSSASRGVLNSAVTALMDKILEVAKRERTDYLAYLESEGLTGSEQFAIVDLGWKGNMQGGLGRLLNKPLVGYYYATLTGAERWGVEGHVLRGYAGEGLGPWSKNPLLARRHLLESIACNTDPSLLTVRRVDGNFSPVFKEDNTPHTHKLTIHQIHEGAVQFAEQFEGSFSEFLQTMRIDPELSAALLSRFIQKPHALDAALFAGITFEDTFGGVASKSILSGAKLWPEGEAAIDSGEPDQQREQKPEKKVAKIAPSNKKLLIEKEPSAEKPLAAADTAVESDLAANSHANRLRHSASKFPTIERFLVERFASEQKRRKYLRNPERYFRESKSPLSRIWLIVR